MYVDFLADAPELKELFADYIGYMLLSQRLRENRAAPRDGVILGITRRFQEATAALQHKVDANYPPNFRAYIQVAAERIINRTPNAERYFIDRLSKKPLTAPLRSFPDTTSSRLL